MKFETEQELFNHIVAHAASMDGPAVDGYNDNQCVYRSPAGNKCLVGACISDGEYGSWMEGLLVGDLISQFPELIPYYDILGSCQGAHDSLAKLYLAHQDKNRFSAELLEKLRTVAKEFNLDFVLPNEGDK